MINALKALTIAAVLLGFAWLAHYSQAHDANHGYTPQERAAVSRLIERESVPVSLQQRQVAATVYLYTENGERF